MKKFILLALLLASAPAAHALDPTTLAPIKMAGTCAYGRKGAQVQLYCQQIASYRDPSILSGTMVFQLWASRSNSLAGPKPGDFKMAEVQIGKLQGHQYISDVQRSAVFFPPPAGTYYIIFVLGEWNGTTYVPIDFLPFVTPKTFGSKMYFQYGAQRVPGT